jgi:hypothetical protein
MNQSTDLRIQARVRILLARKWVDLRSLTVGTTNGVVYLGGRLRLTGRGRSEAGEGAAGDKAWLSRLRQEIGAIPEVDDVVFQFHELEEAS